MDTKLNARIVRPALLALLALLAVAAWGSAHGLAAAPTGPDINGPKIVGYFPEWGVYDVNYHVADIPAQKLNVVNYAFAAPTAGGGVALSDSYAAVEKLYPGDKEGQPLAGSLNQLILLKQKYPHLRTMISIGGWTLSKNFSDAALTDVSRKNFARSAVEFIRRYQCDGVDIDWEYPVSGGLKSNKARPQDKQNFTLLLQELRRQLDDAGTAAGRKYYLTIAAPAGPEAIANLELAAIAKTVDWINLMGYDLHGAGDDETGHHASLKGQGPGDPLSVASAVATYLAAGVPAKQIVLGVPFYGQGWKKVSAKNNGMYQPAGGKARGTRNQPGLFDYADLTRRLSSRPDIYKRFWDNTAQAPWIYAPTLEGGVAISYEDVQSIHAKTQFVKDHSLGGIMFWELSTDTRSPSDSLLEAIYKDLK